MRAYTLFWFRNHPAPTLSRGLGVGNAKSNREPALFIGQSSARGRQIRVPLDAATPPVMEGIMVHDASVPMPDEGPPPECVLIACDADDPGYLVRINTNNGQRGHTFGAVRPAAGDPVIAARGLGTFEHGINGEGWEDVLVGLRPGDAVFVRMSHGQVIALYATATDLCWEPWSRFAPRLTLRALPDVYVAPPALPAFTVIDGRVEPGVQSEFLPDVGPVVALGYEFDGASQIRVPIVGDHKGDLTSASILPIENAGSVLLPADSASNGAGLLVRVRIEEREWWSHPKGMCQPILGSPERIDFTLAGPDERLAVFDGGSDQVWILREGDAIEVVNTAVAPVKRYGVSVTDGRLDVGEWGNWKLRNAERYAEHWKNSGEVLASRVPEEWIGNLVRVRRSNDTFLAVGELLSLNPLTINLSLFGDFEPWVCEAAAWVVLDRDALPPQVDSTAPQLLFEVDPPVVADVVPKRSARDKLLDAAQILARRAGDIVRDYQSRNAAPALYSGLERFANTTVEALAALPDSGLRSLRNWVEDARFAIATTGQ